MLVCVVQWRVAAVVWRPSRCGQSGPRFVHSWDLCVFDREMLLLWTGPFVLEPLDASAEVHMPALVSLPLGHMSGAGPTLRSAAPGLSLHRDRPFFHRDRLLSDNACKDKVYYDIQLHARRCELWVIAWVYNSSKTKQTFTETSMSLWK